MTNQQTYLPSAYRCIAIWGRNMGSFASYTANEQHKAAEQGAPLTAVYERNGGGWATLEDVENVPLRNEIIGKLAVYATTQTYIENPTVGAVGVEDVMSMRPDLSEEQARQVIDLAAKRFDASIGICWDILEYWTDELFPDGEAWPED